MSWHVLTDGEQFWGQRWEVMNTALRRPRSVMGDLQAATLCNVSEHHDGVEDESRLAKAILGINLYAVEVDFKVPGKDDKDRDVKVVIKAQTSGASQR